MKYFKIIIILLITRNVLAQDAHFSQYSEYPQYINPALAGLFEGNYRVNLGARSQWGFNGNAYKTIIFNADANLFRGNLSNDYMGAGIFLNSDRAGDGRFTTNAFGISVAYHKGLNDKFNHFISVGIQAGVRQRKLDVARLVFEDQYQNGSVNGNTAESGLNNLSLTFPDFSAGINYYVNATENITLYTGFSYNHIKKNNISFFNNTEEILQNRNSIYAGVDFLTNNNIEISPKFLYQFQNPSKELIAGLNFKYYIQNEYNKLPQYFSIGFFNRFSDAVFFVGKYSLYNFSIGLSYDINTSTLSEASNGKGGPEISIGYVGNINGNSRDFTKDIKCPSF